MLAEQGLCQSSTLHPRFGNERSVHAVNLKAFLIFSELSRQGATEALSNNNDKKAHKNKQPCFQKTAFKIRKSFTGQEKKPRAQEREEKLHAERQAGFGCTLRSLSRFPPSPPPPPSPARVGLDDPQRSLPTPTIL